MEEKTEEKEMEKLKIKEERRRNVSKYIERTEEGIFKLKHEDDTIDNTEELTEEQIHDLSAIFNLFDKNSQEEISSKQLRKMMLSLSQDQTDKGIIGFADGVATVSFDEFLDMIKTF